MPTVSQPARASRRAFTLVELMMAIVILAVAISGVLGSIVNLDSMRQGGEDLRKAHLAADYVVQALQGTNWDDLNDLTKDDAYLTWARIPDSDSSPAGSGTIDDDTNCLTDDPGAPMVANSQDPRQRRQLPFASGLDDLRIYVEYYRAVSAVDANGALIQDGANLCYAGILQGSLSRTAGPYGEVWTLDPTSGVDTTLGDVNRGQLALTGMSLGEHIPSGAGFRNRIPPILITSSVDVNADGTPDSIEPVLLDPARSIASLSTSVLGPNDPVAARVIVSWVDHDSVRRSPGPQRRQLILITGLKR